MKIKLLFASILYLFLSGWQDVQAQVRPEISSFTPASAAPGASVTLTGSNFNTTTTNNIVYLGATRATVTAATATSLTVTVPSGASYAPINVLNMASGLIGASNEYFIPVPGRRRPGALTAADFAENGNTSTTANPLSHVASSDLDMDGKPDLVVTTPYSVNTVFILKNTSTATAVSFANPISHATGSTTMQMIPVVGDLNGDGRPDIVVAGSSSGTFTALENTGNLATFTQRNISASPYASAAGIADFDGDGKMDVVIGHSDGGSPVKLYRNNGTPGAAISFESPIDISTRYALHMVVADLNSDGKPDIVMGKGPGLTILENTSALGVISFSESSMIGPTLGAMTLGDLDNDGKLDLITTMPNPGGDISIYRNTSAGSISFVSQTLSAGAPQQGVSVGDLNGDGRLDLYVALTRDFGSFDYRTEVFTNTSSSGSISFGSPFQLPTGFFPNSTLVGDMNGDGLADLLSVTSNENRVKIYRSVLQYPPVVTAVTPEKAAPGASITISGSGFNSTAANNVVYFGGVKATVTAATANVLTLTVPFGATHSLISVLNTGSGMSVLSLKEFLPTFSPNKATLRTADFSSPTTLGTEGSVYPLISADFDRDGKPDLLTNAAGSIRIQPNTGGSGTISFGSPTALAFIGDARYAAVSDVNVDGWLDIAIPSPPSNRVFVFRNSGSGAISFGTAIQVTTSPDPFACVFADLDGDGLPELVVSHAPSTNIISVFPNTSSAGLTSFGAPLTFTVGNSPGLMTVNDFDGDGRLDVAVPASNENKVLILRNTGGPGQISFAPPVTLATGNFPFGIQSGDLNGDGKSEIIVTHLTSSTVSIFRNDSSSGALSFSAGPTLPTGNAPRGVSLGDLNGDGRPDIAVASTTDNTLLVFPNAGSGGTISLGTPVSLNITAGARDVLLADLDGDGRADITAGAISNADISIFRNVLSAAPTVQTTALNFSSTTATGTTINWTNGNGAARVVWVKAGTMGSPAPADETSYTANTTFGSGSQIGAGGWYAVYNGTGSAVTVTGLTAETDYRVMVTEYNSTSGLELYQTAGAATNPAGFTTASSNAELAALSLSSGALHPVFNASTSSYSSTVGPDIAFITATLTPSQGNASMEVRVNGGTYMGLTSGTASSSLALNGGSNTIDVKVRAQDGTTIKTYTVTVIRQINQTITFAGSASLTYGTADFDPGASSNHTGIPITYLSDDPAVASIVSGKIHIWKAGTVNITASQAGNGTYVAAADQVQALTIHPKSISLTLNASPALMKTYDGTRSIGLAAANYTLNGVESGDVVTVSGTAVFDTKDAGNAKTITANSFTLAGAQKDNYSLSTSSATTTGSIMPKNLTVSLSSSPAIGKTYDGTTDIALVEANYNLNGVETGDAVTVSGTVVFDTKNVGTGKTITANSFTLAGAEKDNYSLSTSSAATTGSIIPKNLTVSLNSSPAISKTYDGTTDIALVAANYNLIGIETGDAVTVGGDARFDNKNAGDGKTIIADRLVLSGPDKDNYNLIGTSARTTGSIRAKSITVSLNPVPAIKKTYDGSSGVNLADANYTLNGMVSGDAVMVSGTVRFNTKNAGEGKPITADNFVLSGADKDNYRLSNTNASTSGTIEKKVLMVRADDQSRLQGAVNPVFSLGYSGFINGEGPGELSVLPMASTTATRSSAPGTYPITAGGGSAGNYSFSYTEGILTVLPMPSANAAPTLDLVSDKKLCYTPEPQSILLSGISAGAGDASQSITLSVSATNSGLFSRLDIVAGANGTAILTYALANAAGGNSRVTVTVTDDGGTANGGINTFSRSFEVGINSPLMISSDAGTRVSKGAVITLTAAGGTGYTWRNAQGRLLGENTEVITVRPMENTTYTVRTSADGACTNVASISIEVLDDYKFSATNFLTPNGDGKNDFWVIKNIDAYPNNQVTVFDAAGRPVYKKKGYTNSEAWGGDVNGSLLTEGSYFYVIDFGNGEQIFKGFITILKDR